MATAPVVLVPIDEIPKVERARAGRKPMYPGIVRDIVSSPGQLFTVGVFNPGVASQRRKGLLKVPVTGGKLFSRTQRLSEDTVAVYARFDRKGRGAVTVAGQALEPVAAPEAPAEA